MGTEISTIGEFGLIKRLTDNIEIKNAETHYGVGDDCLSPRGRAARG